MLRDLVLLGQTTFLNTDARDLKGLEGEAAPLRSFDSQPGVNWVEQDCLKFRVQRRYDLTNAVCNSRPQGTKAVGHPPCLTYLSVACRNEWGTNTSHDTAVMGKGSCD